jgi:hypothetical protein
VSVENVNKLTKWVTDHRVELLPYILTCVIDSGEGSLCALDESLRGHLPLLAHWGSPASEIILAPAALMAIISQIIATKQVTSDQNAQIGRLSEGMRLLILHDSHETRVQSSSDCQGTRRISDQLVRLLEVILNVAQSALKGDKGPATTLGWPRTSPKLGEQGGSACSHVCAFCCALNVQLNHSVPVLTDTALF